MILDNYILHIAHCRAHISVSEPTHTMPKRQDLISPNFRTCDSQLSNAPGEIIRLITLHWEEDPANNNRGGKNFSEEANELRKICQNKLGFEVDNFIIPSENPQFKLLNYIEKTVSETNQAKREKRCPALIIFHYGGHGDPNDQDRDIQKRGEAVWAQWVLLLSYLVELLHTSSEITH